MSQNDFQIADADGATVLADFNSALQALATLSSGNSAPSTTYAGQLWWDTGNDKIKIRNGANSAWVDFAHYDGVTYEPIAAGSDVLKADPEHATDSATDTYDSATNTTPPADGVQIVRDFQSANGTTTPTLDGKTLTTKDGSALWAGAVSGVHALQRDETADTYLVLEPNPSSQLDPIAYTDAGDPTLASEVDATNGGADNLTEIDFTGIKTGAKRITVIFRQLSWSGTDVLLVQLGDSGGFETSGYNSIVTSGSGGDTTEASGIGCGTAGNNARTGSGHLVLTRFGENRWVSSLVFSDTGGSDGFYGTAEKQLSAELDRIRITLSGTDTFDGGHLQILVE